MEKRNYTKERSLAIAFGFLKKLTDTIIFPLNGVEEKAKAIYLTARENKMTHRGIAVVMTASLLLSCEKYGLDIDENDIVEKSGRSANEVKLALAALKELFPQDG